MAAARTFHESSPGIRGDIVSSGRCYFDCGGSIPACYEPVADGDAIGDGWRRHPNEHFYFAVDDLERSRAAASAAGALEIEPIGRMRWGETLFDAKDPIGNPICLVERGAEFTG